MSGLMQCPSCKENIDDDSRYCDQCGEQIFVCSSCGRPGKGKRCIFDGKEMISAGSKPSQTDHLQQPVQADQEKQSAPPQPQAPSPPPAGEKIKLSSQSLGITIEASPGDILGRTKGPFAGILGRFSHISGSHCKFVKTAAGWSIEDTGSTNGTFYNNSRLAANTPVPVQSGTSVKLADIDLLITYDAAGGTQRI
jgi:predicted component of type VI protein secretion system